MVGHGVSPIATRCLLLGTEVVSGLYTESLRCPVTRSCLHVPTNGSVTKPNGVGLRC